MQNFASLWTRSVIFLLGLGWITHLSSAQDTTVISLPTITVEATRQLETYSTAARSIFVRDHDMVQSEPGLSLQRALRGLPGIQISERGHFALGERILVRGMGYRAAFGVRGLQAFLNGVPLTMPDGQSMLDIVDPVFIGRSELLRGPSSLFWGNASGGVLHLANGKDSSPLRVRYMTGSYGLSHTLVSSSLKIGVHHLTAYASRVEKTGYRAHSKGDFLRAGITTQSILRPHTTILFTVNSAFQDVLSPGSLTLEQLDMNRKQADARNERQSAGKESIHVQSGVTLLTRTSLGHLTATAYGIRRSLDNPLSFAWINLERIVGGIYAQLQNDLNSVLSLTAGLDLRTMSDDRIRWNNESGRPGQRLLLDQKENVESLSLFAGLSTRFSSRWGITGGLRLDRMHFQMTDALLSNGDQSGDRNFTAMSPSIGVYYQSSSLTWYSNVGTAFETPTTTELINSPTGQGGFNTDLDPQTTIGMETGVRGLIKSINLDIDVSVYLLRIQDRLLPQQAEDGRTWYFNRGKNRHYGVEIALEWPAGQPFRIHSLYQYGSFSFLNGRDEGLQLPGVPAHQAHLTLHGSSSNGWTSQIVLEAASKMWGNNTNTVQSDGFMVIDVYLSRSDCRLATVTVNPFVRIQNILNSQYVRSLVVNAFGGRYFEPAEGRSFQIGLGINL